MAVLLYVLAGATYNIPRIIGMNTETLMGAKSQLYFLDDREWAMPSMDFDISDDVSPLASTTKVRMAAVKFLQRNFPNDIIDVQNKARLETDQLFDRLIATHYDLDSKIVNSAEPEMKATLNRAAIANQDLVLCQAAGQDF